MSTLQFEGRIVLVTGAGSGIGLASSRAFAAEGARLIIADRDIALAQDAASGIRAAGGDAVAYQVDVGTLLELRDLFDFIASTYGKLHVLFSHAGVQGPLGLHVSEAQFDKVMNINLKSHFFATQFGVPLLRSCAPHASVIYTSSTSGLRAGTLSPLYSTTKAAIVMLARSMARQLGPDKIRVNAICPGPVETPFSREYSHMAGRDDAAYAKGLQASGQTIPLGRVAQPDDVVGTALFLASDLSTYLSGIAIPVDGGLTA